MEPPAKEAWAIFAGRIDNAAVARFMSNMTGATSEGFTHLHLLFQSFGGVVGDGVCLYNFFRALPSDLTIYNSGKVESIATIAFLGAGRRVASNRATFMVHRNEPYTIGRHRETTGIPHERPAAR